jgi:hypothetical protein
MDVWDERGRGERSSARGRAGEDDAVCVILRKNETRQLIFSVHYD